MRIIRFEDEQGQVRYGFDRDVVRDGVAGDQVDLHLMPLPRKGVIH